jgi:soluble lytic murein transglycosylase-like protein
LRAILIPVFLGALIFGVSANGMTFRESSVPEAVYYANAYADHYHLPRELIHAIIEQESGWNQRAISNKGAIGLMQLMQATAAHFFVRNPTSIQDNIGGGVLDLYSFIELDASVSSLVEISLIDYAAVVNQDMAFLQH